MQCGMLANVLCKTIPLLKKLNERFLTMIEVYNLNHHHVYIACFLLLIVCSSALSTDSVKYQTKPAGEQHSNRQQGRRCFTHSLKPTLYVKMCL